jgi:hypothetical protein
VDNLELKILIFDIDMLKTEISSKKEKIEHIKNLALEHIKNNTLEEEIIPNGERIKAEDVTDKGKENEDEKEKVKKENINKDKKEDKTDEEIERKIKKNSNASPFLKKLFRKIVMKTHPDKIQNDKLNELYIQAVDFYEKNNDVELILIGNKLDIVMEDIDPNIVKKFTQYKDTLKKKSLTLDYNDFYVWYTTKNPKLKNLMFIKLKRRFKI